MVKRRSLFSSFTFSLFLFSIIVCSSSSSSKTMASTEQREREQQQQRRRRRREQEENTKKSIRGSDFGGSGGEVVGDFSHVDNVTNNNYSYNPIGTPNACASFDLIKDNILNADNICHCEGRNIVCQYTEVCTTNCAVVTIEVNFSEDGKNRVTSCSTFTNNDQYDRTCVDVYFESVAIGTTTPAPDANQRSINGASDREGQTVSAVSVDGCVAAYGTDESKLCKCDICTDGGVAVDCTEFAPGATTSGCQTLNSVFTPILPGFRGNGNAETGTIPNLGAVFVIQQQESSVSQLTTKPNQDVHQQCPPKFSTRMRAEKITLPVGDIDL